MPYRMSWETWRCKFTFIWCCYRFGLWFGILSQNTRIPIRLVWMGLNIDFSRFLVAVTDLSEAMSVSTSPDSSKEEEDFPPPPAELLHPDNSGEYTHTSTHAHFPPPPAELLHPDNSGEYTHTNTHAHFSPPPASTLTTVVRTTAPYCITVVSTRIQTRNDLPWNYTHTYALIRKYTCTVSSRTNTCVCFHVHWKCKK